MHAFARNCRREWFNARTAVPLMIVIARVTVTFLFDASRGRVILD